MPFNQPAKNILIDMRVPIWISTIAMALCATLKVYAQPTIYGVQIRASTPNFQLFNHINDDSTIANPDSPLFVIAGGIYGATFLNDTFYGVELENGTGNEFLVTIPHEGDALGARLSSNQVGFANVEGLANVDGQLMAISVDFGGHITRLISIDHQTGVGTLIGQGTFDVILVGLAYDPVTETLYGAGIPFGGNNNASLYTIDPSTGATTLVGNLGATLQSLSWNASLGLIGSFDHLYQVDAASGQATQIGTTDYTDGLGVGEGIFNGIYALAAIPTIPPAEIGTVSIISIAPNSNNEVVVTWESELGFNYQVEINQSLQPNDWSMASDPLPGQSVSMSATLDAGAPLDPKYYRVRKFQL